MNKKIIILFLFFLICFLTCCKEEINPQINDNNDITENNEEPKECTHVFKNGKCELCGETCPHEFENSICKICGYHCQHNYLDGICTICGNKCLHEEYSNGICSICNYHLYEHCEHEYDDGICLICDYHCPHLERYNGFCKECDFDLSIGCDHEYVNGQCTKCSIICKHYFVDSVCQKCGFVCTHDDLKCGETCKICYYEKQHKIKEGRCVVCGKLADLVTQIPSRFLDPNCPEKGTVEKVVFQSYDYNNNRPYENTFFVYLPYGYYDNNDEYNVFYLTHGSGENAAYWLAQLSYAGGYTEKTKIVLDNLHYYFQCKPTIVVTPTENLNGTANFYKELVENIMPLAETLYRTKAHLYGKNVNEVTKQAFIDSRMYRAYAGLSRGSMIGYSVMAYDIAYFGYFGYYSGGSYGLTKHLNDCVKMLNDPNIDYKIYYAYHSCGTNDAMYQNHVDDYKTLLRTNQNKLVEDKNTEFFVKQGFSHNYDAWIVDLYNSLGFRFFKFNDK